MGGANGSRASWVKHCPEFSVDSILSNYSGARLGRPGLGDNARVHVRLWYAVDGDFSLATGVFRGAYAAKESPLESLNISPGMILSWTVATSRRTATTVEDAIFEKTGHRTSVSSSDSTFFGKNSEGP